MGDLVGPLVCRADGEIVGGPCDGSNVGSDVGVEVAALCIGVLEGFGEWASVGGTDGFGVGATVDTPVGFRVGLAATSFEGSIVGGKVGPSVSSLEGVGAFVVLVDGHLVGCVWCIGEIVTRDGTTVGVDGADGFLELFDVGSFVGDSSIASCRVGEADGVSVVREVGDVEGRVIGELVGLGERGIVGATVGSLLGESVGPAVGGIVHVRVGRLDGPGEGAKVGLAMIRGVEGLAVGVCVGFAS